MRERAGRCTGFNSSWPKLSSLPRRDSSRRSACVPAVHPAPGVVRALPVAVATQTGETGPFVADLGPTPYPRRTVCTGPSPTLVARRYPRFRLTAPPWASIKLNLAAPKRSLRDGHPDPLRCPPPRPPPPGGTFGMEGPAAWRPVSCRLTPVFHSSKWLENRAIPKTSRLSHVVLRKISPVFSTHPARTGKNAGNHAAILTTVNQSNYERLCTNQRKREVSSGGAKIPKPLHFL